MKATTIHLSEKTRERLAGMKRGGETYDDVVRLLVDDHEREPITSSPEREVAE